MCEVVDFEDTRGKCVLLAGWTPAVERPDELKVRFVAKELKWWEQRDDLFTLGSLNATARLVDFCVLRRGQPTFIIYCSNAFYHAPEYEKVYVRPPLEWVQLRQAEGHFGRERWRLRRQLPGRRTAGKRWIDHASQILMEDVGMERCLECPCFVKSQRGVSLELHMDDFHGTGPAEACIEVIDRLREPFKLKVSPLMNPIAQ